MLNRRIFLGAAGVCAFAKTPTPGRKLAFDKAHAYLRESVEKGEHAGIAAIVARRGQTVFSYAAGHQDAEAKTPMRLDTICRIASMTKAIASAAAMTLYEDGKFLLDDPVAKYIPGFDKVKVLANENGPQNEVVDLARPLTVHHVITHTSGLSNNAAYRTARVFGDQDLAEMAKRIVTVPLAHQPGDAWRYGQGIDVLGRLIEVWSGKTLDVYLQERIFGPLAMKDTAFHVPEAKLPRLSKNYRLNAQGVVEPLAAGRDASKNPAFLSAGGGLYSTASDYLRFAEMLRRNGTLEGARVLSSATVDFMMRNHVPLGLLPNGPNNRRGHGFGIGAAVLLDPAMNEVLSVEGDYNWGGANGTFFWVDRKSEITGIWFVQRPPFIPQPSKKFRVLIYSALDS